MPRIAAIFGSLAPAALGVSSGVIEWKRCTANCGSRTVSTAVARSKRERAGSSSSPASDWLTYQNATHVENAANSQCADRRPRRSIERAIANAMMPQKSVVLARRSSTLGA